MSTTRQTLRGLRRQPGFTGTVVGILALGLALATVVFAIVDALVLDPYPFPDAADLRMVGTAMPEIAQGEGYFERLSGAEVVDIANTSTTLVEPLAFDLNSVRARLGDTPTRLFAGYFASDPFTTLGVEPWLGRGLLADDLPAHDPTRDEDGATGEPVAIVSHDLWRVQLGADPVVIGRPLVIDGLTHTIVGVMPPFSNLFGTDLWLPLEEPLQAIPRSRRHLNLLARTSPDQGHEAVANELALIARRLEQAHGGAHPEYGDWKLLTTSWQEFASFTYRREALLTLGAVLFVLVLVCANLANLLLSRATVRRSEIALRRALGARERHLARQALTEVVTLTGLGGLLAGGLALGALAVITQALPQALQTGGRLPALDGRSLSFLALATIVTSLVLGLAPLWQRLRASPGLLGRGGLRSTHDRGTRRLHGALVAAQVALAVVLLSGALMLTRSFLDLVRTDLGFDTESLISMRLTVPRSEYDRPEIAPFFETLRQQVATAPGVRSASLATQVPPTTRFGGRLVRDEAEVEAGTGAQVFHTAVGDDYFATLGQPLLRGRGLDARDRTEGPVALVLNRQAADTFFPGREALGQRIRVVGGSFDTGWGEVVGVAETVRHQGADQPTEPEVFSHHRQAGGRYNQLFLTVRATGDPHALVPTIRRLVQGLDPDQPVYAIATVDEIVAFQSAPRRLAATVLVGFAVAALLLAALGIYAVVAFAVAHRRREMGLRLALGARRSEILGLVLRETLLRVTVGLVAGLLGVVLLLRLLGTAFGSGIVLDANTLLVATLVLLTAATLAALYPAHRASQTAPARVLRDE